jgi:hypothetical protein
VDPLTQEYARFCRIQALVGSNWSPT